MAQDWAQHRGGRPRRGPRAARRVRRLPRPQRAARPRRRRGGAPRRDRRAGLQRDGRGLHRADRGRDRDARRRGELEPLDAPQVARALVRMLNGYLDDVLGRGRGGRPRARARDGLDDLDAHAVPAAPRERPLARPLAGRGRRPAQGRGAARPARASACGPASGCVTARSATRSRPRWSCCAAPARSSCCATRSGAGRSTDPVTAWVERIDPLTLETVARSPDLAAGPFWPGGHGGARQRLAARRDAATTATGSPRISSSWPPASCRAAALQLVRRPPRRDAGDEGLRPRPARARPRRAARPDDARAPRPATCRSASPRSRGCRPTATTSTWSARGRRCGCAGTARRCVRDERWGGPYLSPGGSYGWDPVIAGGQLWFMDNGAHDFVTTMRGAGVAPGPVHLVRMSLADRDDVERVEVCGLPRGAVTDPPLVRRGPADRRRLRLGQRRRAGVPLRRLADAAVAPRALARRPHGAVSRDRRARPARLPRAGVRAHAGGPRGRPAGCTALMRSAALRRLATAGSRDEVVVARRRDRGGARPRRGAQPDAVRRLPGARASAATSTGAR